MQMMEMQNQNPWGKQTCIQLVEELSDHENMVDEYQLEPDYYIDRPVRILNVTVLAFPHLYAKPRWTRQAYSSHRQRP